MLYALTEDGLDAPLEPGSRAFCPCCSANVIAKCGKLNVWHWAHESVTDCDYWSEPEGPWHKAWKELFPREWREVTLKPVFKKGDTPPTNLGDSGVHRADIKTSAGIVVELQNSPIDSHEIEAREGFYRRMLWIFNAIHWRERVTIQRHGPTLAQIADPDEYRKLLRFLDSQGKCKNDFRLLMGGEGTPWQQDWIMVGDVSTPDLPFSCLLTSRNLPLSQQDWESRRVSLKWSKPRYSLYQCTAQTLWDIGSPHVLVYFPEGGQGKYELGYLVRKQQILSALLGQTEQEVAV